MDLVVLLPQRERVLLRGVYASGGGGVGGGREREREREEKEKERGREEVMESERKWEHERNRGCTPLTKATNQRDNLYQNLIVPDVQSRPC